MTTTETAYCCRGCGATGVRLYREAGVYSREPEPLCNGCVDPAKRGWTVPAVPSPAGFWGHTSTPPEALAEWDALPDTFSRRS